MAYSKPKRKPQPKRKKGSKGSSPGGSNKKPNPNPTVKLNDAKWQWAEQRSNESERDYHNREDREDAKTHGLLERRGLQINKGNWKRYHKSRKS